MIFVVGAQVEGWGVGEVATAEDVEVIGEVCDVAGKVVDAAAVEDFT